MVHERVEKSVVRATSAVLDGIEAREVAVEVDFGQPGKVLHLIGMPDVVVRESRSRILQAVRAVCPEKLNFDVIINLAPAGLRKEGAVLDLPMAVALIARRLGERWQDLADWMIAGELGLDGSVRPMAGTLLIAVLARRLGKAGLIVAADAAAEAATVEGLTVRPVRHVVDVVDFFRNGGGPDVLVGRSPDVVTPTTDGDDFRDIRGQESSKRALIVAAAGAHNLLMVGPPGSGKTMLARALPRILPPLELDQALEAACVHSGVGISRIDRFYVPPFRAPHHTASRQALVGGGVIPRPGEVSLAHHGVLFLDELPEFGREALEVLRQPVEDGMVTIARARESRTYPSRFMLIAAMNPCPCGHAHDGTARCICGERRIQRYRAQISGPLMDRIDIHLPVRRVPIDLDSKGSEGVDSASAAAAVKAARQRQAERFASESYRLNAHIPTRRLARICRLDQRARSALTKALERLQLSARAHVRVLRLARTIADLEGAEWVRDVHLLEAVQYRSLDRA